MGMRQGSPGLSIYRQPVPCRGSILIIAIWSICLLATFAVILSYGIRQKATLASRLDGRSRLRLIAAAGVKRALIELDRQDVYDTLSSAWSDNAAAFREVPVDGGTYDVSYEFFNRETFSMEKRYGAVDEESKININKVKQPVMRDLFRLSLGCDSMKAQELAASIVDWRDQDSFLSIPIGSAEDFDYKGMEYPYDSKDGDFQVLDELLLVNGVSEDIFRSLQGQITIYGEGKININTASEIVLLSLGLQGATVEKIISFRYGADNMLGTEDDGLFISLADIVPQLRQFSPLGESEVADLTRVASQHLCVKSFHFQVRSTAVLADKNDTVEVLCVLDRYGKVLYWREL